MLKNPEVNDVKSLTAHVTTKRDYSARIHTFKQPVITTGYRLTFVNLKKTDHVALVDFLKIECGNVFRYEDYLGVSHNVKLKPTSYDFIINAPWSSTNESSIDDFTIELEVV